jgi:uncharacterized protein (TIRG00374 family)
MKKGLFIFIALSMLACGTVLFSSVDGSSLAVFKKADERWLSAAVLLAVTVLALDSLKLKCLALAAGETISFALSMKLTLINYFGSAVTPMQGGGCPFQMYMMHKRGIGIGKSTAITLVHTILTMFILGIAIPLAIIFKVDFPRFGWLSRGFVFYVITVVALIWFVVLLSLFRPNLIKRVFKTIARLAVRAGLLRRERMIALTKRVGKEIDAYNQIVRDFVTIGRCHFLLGVLAGILQMAAYLSVMPCIIWAVGTPVMYMECVLFQALFLFLLYFIPTPGGSGAAEGGAAVIFSAFVPWSAAGMLGIGWRFLIEYIGIFLGLIVALKELREP